jgi:hypothetical protein
MESMENQTLWGAVYFVYILSIAPKYFSATSDLIAEKLDEKALDQILMCWIIGFIFLLSAHHFQLGWFLGLVGSFSTFGAFFILLRSLN